MKIPAQIWLERQPLSEAARSSFDESFACYRSGADKAALLFAYLGFMNVLRDRVVAASCPNGVPAPMWAQLQGKCGDPESWERAMFDATQQQQPAAIFRISDDLRRQVSYWKDRRNDCAHSRPNKISSSLVEAFYDFVESNLNRFAVGGSREAMVSRILEHFDPSLTSPDTPIRPVVEDIPHAIPDSEMPQFIEDLLEKLEEARPEIDAFLERPNRSVFDFLEAAFRWGSPALEQACKQKLFDDDALLVEFLRKHPDRTGLLSGETTRVRNLWHEHLFRSNSDDFPVLAALLRLHLIPEGERSEALQHVIRRGLRHLPNDIDSETLAGHGFLDELEELICEENLLSQFDWANSSAGLVVKLLDARPISRRLAAAIYGAFDAAEYYAYDCAPAIERFFRQNPGKIAEYRAHVDESGEVGAPRQIPSLGTDQEEET